MKDSFATLQGTVAEMRDGLRGAVKQLHAAVAALDARVGASEVDVLALRKQLENGQERTLAKLAEVTSSVGLFHTEISTCWDEFRDSKRNQDSCREGAGCSHGPALCRLRQDVQEFTHFQRHSTTILNKLLSDFRLLDELARGGRERLDRLEAQVNDIRGGLATTAGGAAPSVAVKGGEASASPASLEDCPPSRSPPALPEQELLAASAQDVDRGLPDTGGACRLQLHLEQAPAQEQHEVPASHAPPEVHPQRPQRPPQPQSPLRQARPRFPNTPQQSKSQPQLLPPQMSPPAQSRSQLQLACEAAHRHPQQQPQLHVWAPSQQQQSQPSQPVPCVCPSFAWKAHAQAPAPSASLPPADWEHPQGPPERQLQPAVGLVLPRHSTPRACPQRLPSGPAVLVARPAAGGALPQPTSPGRRQTPAPQLVRQASPCAKRWLQSSPSPTPRPPARPQASPQPGTERCTPSPQPARPPHARHRGPREEAPSAAAPSEPLSLESTLAAEAGDAAAIAAAIHAAARSGGTAGRPAAVEHAKEHDGGHAAAAGDARGGIRQPELLKGFPALDGSGGLGGMKSG